MTAKIIHLSFVLAIISSLQGIAQDPVVQVVFNYDANGNRISREIIYYQSGLKSGESEEIAEEVMEEIEFDKGLNVYPNPATESLYVTVNQDVLDATRSVIFLFDNLGKQVLTLNELAEVNQLNVSTLPKGTYILKLIFDTHHKEWLIIVQ